MLRGNPKKLSAASELARQAHPHRVCARKDPTRGGRSGVRVASLSEYCPGSPRFVAPKVQRVVPSELHVNGKLTSSGAVRCGEGNRGETRGMGKGLIVKGTSGHRIAEL